MLVIGPEEKRAAKELHDALGGPRIKTLFMTPLEYAGVARRDRALYESLERDCIRLV